MKKIVIAISVTFFSFLTIVPVNAGNGEKSNLDSSASKANVVFEEQQKFSLVLQIVSLGILAPMKLTTIMDESGITYRYSFIQFRKRKIVWQDVDTVYVRQYRPVKEYGGWGIRYSFRNGKAFNVSGKQGVQLVMKNGKRILFGTQNPEEAKKFLDEMAAKKIINSN